MNFINKRFKKNSEYEQYVDDPYYGGEENLAVYGNDEGCDIDDYGNETVVDGAAFEMKLVTPKDYSDREDIARCLVNGNAVFLNIEQLDRASIIRLMDYLSGVIYVIEGKVKWSNSSSVIFAPKNVNISGLDDEEPVAEPEEEAPAEETEATEDYYG